MKIVMEKYHGFGYDYLIWDPLKNNMQLDYNRVKAITKSNLGIGSIGILYGPITEENNAKFKVFNSNGSENNIDEFNINIFLKYMDDAGYRDQESCNISSLKEELGDKQKKVDIHNTGFIILNNEFVKELEII